MKVSLQLGIENGWDNNNPVIHDVETWNDALEIAYAISHQLGNITVRVVEIPKYITQIDLRYIGALSGTYVQGRIISPNFLTKEIFKTHNLGVA